MLIIEQMYDSFADLQVFEPFSIEVENLIFHFAYGMTRGELHNLSNIARSATFRMPVPKTWRLLVDEHNVFKWRKFLEEPNTILIDVEAVKETLDLIEDIRYKWLNTLDYFSMGF